MLELDCTQLCKFVSNYFREKFHFRVTPSARYRIDGGSREREIGTF